MLAHIRNRESAACTNPTAITPFTNQSDLPETANHEEPNFYYTLTVQLMMGRDDTEPLAAHLSPSHQLWSDQLSSAELP